MDRRHFLRVTAAAGAGLLVSGTASCATSASSGPVTQAAGTATIQSNLSAPAVIRARDKADSLAGNLNAMSAQFTATGARLDSVLMLVQTGRGTLGRFATDSALYWNMVRLTASLDSLVNDIKQHPGKIGVTVKMF